MNDAKSEKYFKITVDFKTFLYFNIIHVQNIHVSYEIITVEFFILENIRGMKTPIFYVNS